MDVSEIKELPDVSEGLENSIKKAVNESNKLSEIIESIKSKRYTQTRIYRILLYALLGISKKEMQNAKGLTPYTRVLGVSNKAKELLSKATSSTNVITSVKKFLDESPNEDLKQMLKKNILATNIYTLGYVNNSVSNLDYTCKLLTL